MEAIPDWFWQGLGPAVSVIAIVGAAVFIVFSLRRFQHGDPALLERRKRALLSGPVRDGTPFELQGAGRGTQVTLFVDMDFSVPWSDIAATLSECGFRFEYRLSVAEHVVQESKIHLPRDRFPTNRKGKREIVELQIGNGGTRTRCTSAIAHFSAPTGAPVTVSGKVTCLPDNTLRELLVWVG